MGHQQRYGAAGGFGILERWHAGDRSCPGGMHARAHAGRASSTVFALALLFAGVSSSITAGMAAGTISAGLAGETYDVRDRHQLDWRCVHVFAGDRFDILRPRRLSGACMEPGAFVFAAAHHSFCPDMAHELPARYGKVCKRRRTKGNC